MKIVEVLGPGCNNCRRLEAAAREAVTMAGVEAEIRHVTDYAEILGHMVMSTPGARHRWQGGQRRPDPVRRRHPRAG